jgi:hypothetical protein
MGLSINQNKMDTPRIDALIGQCRRNLAMYPHGEEDRRKVERYIAELETKREMQNPKGTGMKTISFLRRTVPHGAQTYGDLVTTGQNGKLLAEFSGRTWPNPFRPSDAAPFDLCYGGLAPGTCCGRFVATHPHFGRCIELAEGNELPGLWPNRNEGMRSVVSGVFVHRGNEPDWSGSAGEPTIDPAEADRFFEQFSEGEDVMVEIKTL